MKIKNGNTMEGFEQELQKINSSSCSIINKRKGKVNIFLQFDNNQMCQWVIEKVPSMLQGPKIKNGKKYDTFLTTLHDFYKENNILDSETNDAVLCYRDTEKTRIKGKIVSNWFQLDLGVPYQLINGQPKFEVIRLELTEWEYEKMMETRLAFTHDDIIYPILNVAIHSVGTKLDCTVAFKSIDTCPLGAALLIAEKFSNLKCLQIIYRECTDKIRPILSVGGDSFQHIPITEFFSNVISNFPGIYYLEKWYVTCMDATAYFSVHGYKKDLLVKIEGGDLPGKSVRVSAVLMYHGYEIPLKTNRIFHKGTITDEQYKNLFDGIYDAFDLYLEKREDIVHCPDLSNVKVCLGKKRCNKIDFQALSNLYDKRDIVVKKIIDATCVKLNPRQDEDLKRSYGAMFL